VASADEDEEIADNLRSDIATVLKAAFADLRSAPPAVRDLILEAVAAQRKVGRAGFRREDRADAGMLAALQAGAAAVVALDRELDRLTVSLPKKAALADVGHDQTRFLQTFQCMYAA